MSTTTSRRLVSLALVAALAGGSLAGCSTNEGNGVTVSPSTTTSAGTTGTSSTNTDSSAATGATSDGATSTGSSDTAGSTSAHGTIPTTLTMIESESIAAFDAARAKDWPIVEEAALAIRGSVNALGNNPPAGMRKDVVPSLEQYLGRLEHAAAQQDGPMAAQAANDLLATSSIAMDQIGTGRPTEIDRLNFIGRQLILDADSGAWTAAEQTVGRARKDLAAMQGDLEAHDGAQLARDLGATLDQLDTAIKAKDAARVHLHATAILNSINELRAHYE